jgi:hypothetical protein
MKTYTIKDSTDRGCKMYLAIRVHNDQTVVIQQGTE